MMGVFIVDATWTLLRRLMAGEDAPGYHPLFVTIPEASQLALQAGSIGEDGEVFVLDMGEPVRIANLARKMIYPMGLT
ncbi:polysaccharide biosynthesis protein [Tamilnaduibacter salinus]|uniref:Polysaccharide biosynthesis protein n=1 Tax=Tamilnaduibacter salinus TaxID=1484056 RepID=A0A2U1D101_9GAMM|nr:polysaccharide biosynthesis protein [Tamilnaduibacter salinus]